MKPSEAVANIEYARKWLGSESDFSDEALDMSISALEKQEPQRPKVKGLLFYSYHMYGSCPCCKGQVEESWRFCPWCGQALNWGDDDD